MNRIATMQARLTSLEPIEMEIADDSHKHAGHSGARNGGGHFVLRIVSPQFAGKNAVVRHRMVYSALGEMMKCEIHALDIRAYAPNEI
jgi:BolA protein